MRFSPGKAIGVMLMSLGVSLAVANERETICAHAKLQGAAAYARCLVRVTKHTKWPSRAGAIDSTTRCENAKLQAAGTYAECLVQAAKRANLKGDELTDARIEHCDEQFDRAFERAEADESCRTAGGPATLRGAIRGQLEETFGLATTAGGCASTPSFDQDTLSYTCTLTSGSAVDLSAIIEQINDAQITADTVVWIEAWGGGGGPGNTSNGGSGAAGGYAQVTTTVDDLMRFLGTSDIYYYLGVNGGGPAANAGGDGGTATIVTINDLTEQTPVFFATLLVAGGGGGGGGGRGTSSACFSNVTFSDLDVLGGFGGDGGEAISSPGNDAFAAGVKGGERREHNFSGSGGGATLSVPVARSTAAAARRWVAKALRCSVARVAVTTIRAQVFLTRLPRRAIFPPRAAAAAIREMTPAVVVAAAAMAVAAVAPRAMARRTVSRVVAGAGAASLSLLPRAARAAVRRILRTGPEVPSRSFSARGRAHDRRCGCT